MKRDDEYHSGKISLHFQGEGVPSPDQVLARAQELAEIDGFERSHVNDKHIREAYRELLGKEPVPEDIMESITQMVSRDEILGACGTHKVNYMPDESSVAEELVKQGLEEAVHDEMRIAAQTEERKNRGLGHDDRGELPD